MSSVFFIFFSFKMNFFTRFKINSILYIFEKLKKLEIPPNSLIDIEEGLKNEENNEKIVKNPYLNSKKGHLIYLFPLLTNCIMTKEPEVKLLLKDLFEEISLEMNLNKFYSD